MHSKGVWCLNHDISTSLGLGHNYPSFPRIYLHSAKVQQCKGAPILPSMGYQYA